MVLTGESNLLAVVLAAGFWLMLVVKAKLSSLAALLGDVSSLDPSDFRLVSRFCSDSFSGDATFLRALEMSEIYGSDSYVNQALFRYLSRLSCL